MKHGSLFSGIGGFELAASWMNWDNVFNCELEPFCRKVLNYHFPNSIQHEDIRTTDFSIYRGKIDLLTMGVPCQPYSLSGERKGTEDPRHLWPEAYRSVREIQPAFVVFENVYGLVNWDGGVVFDQVQADLEVEGYETAPFILPACAVGRDQRRDRLWIVAYNKCFRRWKESEARLEMDEWLLQERKWQQSAIRHTARSFPSWLDAATDLCGVVHGVSGRLVNETFPGWRTKSLHAFGNAIVPQVAFQIFKAIQAYDRDTKDIIRAGFNQAERD